MTYPWGFYAAVAGGPVFAVVLLVLHWRIARTVGGDGLIERVTFLLGQHQVQMEERIRRLDQLVRGDLDALHKRLEYLEERDRERQ